MTTFTIDTENNITAHATPEEAAATPPPFDSFSSQQEFAELAKFLRGADSSLITSQEVFSATELTFRVDEAARKVSRA